MSTGPTTTTISTTRSAPTISGDDAVKAVTDWVEKNSNWKESVLIVTADHGHYLVIEKPELLVPTAAK